MTLRGWHRRTALACLCGVLGLAGCTVEPIDDRAQPGLAITPPERPTVAAPSPESQELARYYARYQQRQLTAGLLRTDGGGIDTPYNARLLAQNFERIGLFDEYTLRGGRFVPQQTESNLRRWEDPVRVKPLFGRTVTPARQSQDTKVLRNYVNRLAKVTGADLKTTTGDANYHVLFVDTDDLRSIEPVLRGLIPNIADSTIRDIASMDRFTFCSVYAFSEQAAPYTYVAAIAIIRAEHPDLIRTSCIHEEIAQGLGLANDSPTARPSIFNDDDEFALLTSHDENLLRILYDPRLQPGLTPQEARPTVETIASELMGGES